MINVTTLTNGFRIATDKMQDVETVSVSLAIGVGSRFENKIESGISHFLEHMAFKGTKNRTALDIVKQIECVGGGMNAFTSKEMTVYYVVVLKENVNLAIEILSDIIQNSVFDQDEIEKEKDVILQELANSEDTPDDIVFEFYYENLYKDQPLGRPIIGTRETINSFKTQDFKNYIQSKYNAGNMVLSCAGNVDHDIIVNIASKLFASLQDSKQVLHEKAKYTGGELLKSNKELTQTRFILGYEGFDQFDTQNKYALKIGTNILGGGMSSRLFQEVREKRGLCYTVSSFENSFYDTGIFGIYAGTSNDKLEELQTVVDQELQKIATSIDDEEMNKTLVQIKASLLFSLESTTARSQKLASNLLTHGRFVPHNEIIKNFSSIKKEQVCKVMESVLQTNKTLVVYGNI
jgi:predicted Zn-dependent peptidase